MIEINPERLLKDLYILRSFGGVGNGVVRTAFSDIDMESRSTRGERSSKGISPKSPVPGLPNRASNRQ